MRHIIRWGNSDSEKQSDLELLVKLNTHFIGELIKRVDESVGVLIPRIKRLKTSARTKKDRACESEVLKCNLCKKLWFDVCEEIILTTLSNQIYWLNEQDTTQGFPKWCLSDWLASPHPSSWSRSPTCCRCWGACPDMTSVLTPGPRTAPGPCDHRSCPAQPPPC